MLNDPSFVALVFEYARAALAEQAPRTAAVGPVHDIWPLPNVWMGISIGDLAQFARRADMLRDTPAAVRMISAEPLLGPLVHGAGSPAVGAPRRAVPHRHHLGDPRARLGESAGRGHRPMDLQWVRD